MGSSTQQKAEGCCDACTNTSGRRAWSWDRKSKKCTLISKVDKTGRSNTCCIAGRRKKKLVKTIGKMENKKLTGKQKDELKKLKACKKDTKKFVDLKKKCGKSSKSNKKTIGKMENKKLTGK